MKMVTGSELVRRSNSELSALCHAFHLAVASTKPFTREWSEAVLSVETVLRERKRRVDAGSASL
jgi:hypothetical protein